MEILRELNQTTATAESTKKVIKALDFQYVLFLFIKIKTESKFKKCIKVLLTLSDTDPVSWKASYTEKSVKSLKTVGNKLPTVSIYRFFPFKIKREIIQSI